MGDEILPNYIGIIISQYKDPYKPICNGMSYGFWTMLNFYWMITKIVVTKKGEQNFTEGSSGKMWWKLVGEIWPCTWIAGTIEGAGDVGFFQSSQTDTNGTLFEALKFVGLMINDASKISKWKKKNVSEQNLGNLQDKEKEKAKAKPKRRPSSSWPIFRGYVGFREGR